MSTAGQVPIVGFSPPPPEIDSRRLRSLDRYCRQSLASGQETVVGVLLGERRTLWNGTSVRVDGFIPAPPPTEGDHSYTAIALILAAQPRDVVGVFKAARAIGGPGAEDWAILDRHRLDIVLLLDAPLESASRARVVHRNGAQREVVVATGLSRSGSIAIGAVVAAVTLLAAAAFWTSRPPVPSVTRPSAASLGLRADPNGRAALTVTWDRHAPEVRAAREGSISIRDGEHHSNLALDTRQLAAGSLLYYPAGTEVSFQLRVSGPGGSRVETFRVVVSRPAKPEPAPVAAAPPPPRPPAGRQGVASPRRSRKASVRGIPPSRPSAFVQPAAGSADRQEAASLEPPATAMPADPGRLLPPLPIRAEPPRPDDGVAVTAEPAPRSFVTRMVRRIPFVGKLRKSPKTYVPPRPLSEIRPAFPIRERQRLKEVVPIDVRVRVAEDGSVEWAELAGGAGDRMDLASAALSSARQWKFLPAELDGEKTPGDVLIHFRFSPL